MYKILLVEDDRALAAAMKATIENWGNEARIVNDLFHVTEEFAAYQPHLVLMDIMLPFRDGYWWCAEIRKTSSVPVMFVSSASDNMNIVMAINMGGDDFVAKPVEPMVLNAKLQALLRRTYELQQNTALIPFAGAVLHANDGSVTLNDARIELTKNELRILQTLLENKGRIVSRDTLMTRLWQSDCYVEENTLTVNVNRLRKKLEELGLNEVILTKPGSGYMIL